MTLLSKKNIKKYFNLNILKKKLKKEKINIIKINK
jgi:hypothetical protein